MGKYIITNYKGLRLSALMEEDRLVQASFSLPSCDNSFSVGNIYRASVQKKMDSLKAYFVNLSSDVVAYLPYSECSGAAMKMGDEITVQIIKEAMKGKACVVSMQLHLSGRFIALHEGQTGITYSKKLSKKDIKRIKTAFEKGNTDAPYGITVRTNANDLAEEEIRPFLSSEIQTLSAQMSDLLSYMNDRRVYSLLYKQSEDYLLALYDIRNNLYDEILTDDNEIYNELKSEIKDPIMQDKLRLYDSKGKVMSLLNSFRIGDRLEEAFSKRVHLPSGGNIVIEYTEAMTVIDVNSAKSSLKKSNVKVNEEAAITIMEQIRLRNLCGMILVDFINMDDAHEDANLLILLRRLALLDPIHVSVIDMTPLGLVEITRAKKREPLLEEYRALSAKLSV